MSKRMFRWSVPIDDEWHEIPVSMRPVMAEVTDALHPIDNWRMDVWAEPAQDNRVMHVRVFGTGHEIPDNAQHVVSAPRHARGLVFHLYSLEI